MKTMVTLSVAVLALVAAGDRGRGLDARGAAADARGDDGDDGEGIARGGQPSRPTRGDGLVWRVARPLDTRVVRQVGEAGVGPSVVLVFRVVGRGPRLLHFALTRGDASRKPFARSVTTSA